MIAILLYKSEAGYIKITADFGKITGKIKPMHGVGQPPFIGTKENMMHFIGDAGIPFSRLRDVGGIYGGGRFVDIPNIFRNFDADENLPESYDFTFTDWLIGCLMKQNCMPMFRLGVTIENSAAMKAYRIYPPKDFNKWARICEHIVRHYNEGWADGFRYGIKYWEIWNEPDDCELENLKKMWLGTRKDYFRLYEVTANHLKRCFGDTISVGGFASCGFYAIDSGIDTDGLCLDTSNRRSCFLSFFRDFLIYIGSEEHKAPLDFFSWHSYSTVKEAERQSDYCDMMLEKYGFGSVEQHLNEWNTCHDRLKRSTPFASANALAMMLAMQKKTPSVLNFYDARLGASEYGGMFNPDTWLPYLTYYVFVSFNEAFKLENEVETRSDDGNVYVCGATGKGKSVLLIANTSEYPVDISFDVRGAEISGGEVLLIDGEHTYTSAGHITHEKTLRLCGNGCAEIRL